MGASLSNSAEGGANGGEYGPGLGDIPEACIACVFMYLTPLEICNLARLNRAFRGAASSDNVWESKLPPNYQDLLALLLPLDRYQDLPKKDIFALFARSTPFDDNTKQAWVDKVTGRVCLSISTRSMSITGIEDRRYWSWIPTEESRFQVIAYLQQIWWFEVDGAVQFPLPPDIYTLSFRLHLGKFSKRLGRRTSNFEHTHGWDIKPVRFELTTSDNQHATSECYLDDSESDEMKESLKRGCWIEYKVGEFIVTDTDPVPEVRFSMKQIDCTHSKGGLCVDSVSIIPSDLRERRRLLSN
ncbi:F-box protein PP2-A15-like [Chenopodium quinoa]|uniref:F-box domain-containing protein n=1 Tax=Chenopodium quinoa TaxID=63459 RepID=A0A803MZR2_CHEQI|nr:F-box protein PP2-A15-like [Chenopodium quinoa]